MPNTRLRLPRRARVSMQRPARLPCPPPALARATGSGSRPEDPTGSAAQAALAQALVDGFAADAAKGKLNALAAGHPLAQLQAMLAKQAG